MEPECREKAEEYVSANFKENIRIIIIEERQVKFLGKEDWKLLNGSKVKPFQNIKLCEIAQQQSPLAKIEKICEENHGHGTLACFAKSETGQHFAITAQHVLQKVSTENGEKRYIFSEVSKQEGEKEHRSSKDTIMLSTCSSGLLNVDKFEQHHYYLDIALMELSSSLASEHKVLFTKELEMRSVKRGEEVFKTGVETGRTTGKVEVPQIYLKNEWSEKNKKGLVFGVKGVSATKPFAKSGDSGSLIYCIRKGTKYARGILSQAEPDSSGGLQNAMFYCTYLDSGIKALKKFGGDLTLYDDPSVEKSATYAWLSDLDAECQHCKC